jgi:hypothetical protein
MPGTVKMGRFDVMQSQNGGSMDQVTSANIHATNNYQPDTVIKITCLKI